MKLVARGLFGEILIFDSDFSSLNNGETDLRVAMNNLKIGVGKTGREEDVKQFCLKSEIYPFQWKFTQFLCLLAM